MTGLYESILLKSIVVGIFGKRKVIKEALTRRSSFSDTLTMGLEGGLIGLIVGCSLLVAGLIPISKREYIYIFVIICYASNISKI